MAIQIIGNVGNQGYALPMVSAYPLNPSSYQMLGWNPVAQALDYVPFTGTVDGDFGVVRDLTVGRHAVIAVNASVGGTLTTTGVSNLAGGVTDLAGDLTLGSSTNKVAVTGELTATTTISATTAVNAGAGGAAGAFNGSQLTTAGVKVVGTRVTGWVAATGTATRSTFVTGAVTLPVLAEHVKALIDDLTTHGLIGT